MRPPRWARVLVALAVVVALAQIVTAVITGDWSWLLAAATWGLCAVSLYYSGVTIAETNRARELRRAIERRAS